MAEILLRNEPRYPMHVVPQCWQLFNQKYNVKRGLFFLDGPDWHDVSKCKVRLEKYYSKLQHLLLLDEEENESNISEKIWISSRI